MKSVEDFAKLNGKIWQKNKFFSSWLISIGIYVKKIYKLKLKRSIIVEHVQNERIQNAWLMDSERWTMCEFNFNQLIMCKKKDDVHKMYFSLKPPR